ncbi:MAG: alanine--glyoxylate aminotransferase family protein [Actinomycetota bacterium]|nr:alanine--glyoxylate aminotransferase family protein [Actinomycetota bacterium]
MSPALGPLVPNLEKLVPIDDPANSQGSAYDSGWYGYVDKDLRSLLGRPVKGSTRAASAAPARSPLARPRSGQRWRPQAPSSRRLRRRPDEVARGRAPGANPLQRRSAPAPDALDKPPDLPAGHELRLAPPALASTLAQVAEKRYLMTPGPTPAPPEVLAAIAQPVIHHRGPDYKKLYAECLGRLREVFRTEQEVLLFGGSGTGGMESAVANLCSPGEPVLVVSAGYFGERWAAIARAYGAEVHHLRYAWGEIPSTEETAARLSEREASAVFLTHSETSTGVVLDLQPFAAVAREAGALSVVDAISSLGAVPLETDAWGIDVVVSGAQKALMTPPGLTMISASPAAWEKTASAVSPRFYWDWEITRKGQATLDAPVTPPVSLVAGLNVALGMLLEEGLEAAYERHVRLGRACREGLKAMGLELSSPDDDSSAVVTAARAPEGIDSDELVLLLRDRHGVTLAPGQGELKGKIFRIGHIGYYDVFDITTALAAVELALVELGAEIERGVAVTRALEAFEHTAV